MTEIPGSDLEALSRHLAAVVTDLSGPLQVVLLQGGRSNLTYRLSDGHSSWVLRRPPLGMLTPSAHDMKREFTVTEALWGSGVPVARPLEYCEDADILGVPFLLVEYVDGMVIRGREDLAPFSDDDLERSALALVDNLAILHELDYFELGLGQFGRPQGYLRRQIGRWSSQWKLVATRDLPDLEVLLARLSERVPEESGSSLVHGDFRIDNVIFETGDAAKLVAIVDWEMATLGDPLADLALHIAYRDPAFEPVLGGSAASTSERLPSPRALVERYAKATGKDPCDLGFYLGLAMYKLAVIAEDIHGRHVRGDSVGTGFTTVGDAVPQLVASGLRAMSAGAF